MENIAANLPKDAKWVIRIRRQSFILTALSVYIIQNSSKSIALIAQETGLDGGVVCRRSDALELMLRNAGVHETYAELATLLRPYVNNRVAA